MREIKFENVDRKYGPLSGGTAKWRTKLGRA